VIIEILQRFSNRRFFLADLGVHILPLNRLNIVPLISRQVRFRPAASTGSAKDGINRLVAGSRIISNKVSSWSGGKIGHGLPAFMDAPICSKRSALK
jgi:hypothetical protein